MFQLSWRGRNYRPVGGTGYIRVYKPDIMELMKPLSQKSGLGSAVLTGNIINPKNTSQPIDVTPSSTPNVTPSPTPSVTPNPTPSITPSSTPPAADWGLQNIFNYPQDDTTKTTGSTQFYYAKLGTADFITLVKRQTVANLNNQFSGTGFQNISTATTMNLILSADVTSQNFRLTSYAGNGPWDEQRMTGFTWNGVNRWTGTTRFYSGGTLVYSEPGGFIQRDSVNKTYSLGGGFDIGYFYVLPNP